MFNPKIGPHYKSDFLFNFIGESCNTASKLVKRAKKVVLRLIPQCERTPKAIKEAEKGNLNFFNGQPHDALEAKNTKGETPLILASQCRNFALAKGLIEKKANLFEKDIKGNTALHHASKTDSAMIARLLIEKKLDPSWQNQKGETALHIAVKKSNQATIQTLLTLKADIHTQNNKKKSPLDIATEMQLKTSDRSILKLLSPPVEENKHKTGGEAQHPENATTHEKIEETRTPVSTEKNKKNKTEERVEKIKRLYEKIEPVIHKEIKKKEGERIYEEALEKRYGALTGKKTIPFKPTTIETVLNDDTSKKRITETLKPLFSKNEIREALLLLLPDKLNPLLDNLDLATERKKEIEEKATLSYFFIFALKNAT